MPVLYEKGISMKTVFINLSLRPGAKRRLMPVGLTYVMTAVKKAGFEFDLIDMDIDDLTVQDLEDIFKQKVYDVYAFGCIVTGFNLACEISDLIKTINPGALIVAGNSVATSIPELLLENTGVDIAVLGEGDITIVELLYCIQKGGDLRSVDGLALAREGKTIFTPRRKVAQDIDRFGFPDWDILDLKKYKNYETLSTNATVYDSFVPFPLSAARGCLFSCTFCYHVFKGEKYRRYSKEMVAREIDRLYTKYKANFISFWDELTFQNIRSVEDMLEAISGLSFKIGWEAPCRAGLFKKEHLSLIRDVKASGCDNISFSLENASPEILKAMNKKITVEQFVEQAEALWAGGVTPLTSVVFGYPQETPETIELTIDVCERCNIFPSVGFLLPLPGTPIYQWARENGYIKDEVEYLTRVGDRQDFHINLTKMGDNEFVEKVQSKLEMLAVKQGLNVESVFKTTTYQKPEKVRKTEESSLHAD